MPETAWPIAVAATRFLALTGWRRGEMLGAEMVGSRSCDAHGAACGHKDRRVAAASVARGLRRAARASAPGRARVSGL